MGERMTVKEMLLIALLLWVFIEVLSLVFTGRLS